MQLGLLGQATGPVPGAVGELALALPGCQGEAFDEVSVPAAGAWSQPLSAAKGRGWVPPRVGTLLAPQDIPVQAGEGGNPPLWQPFLFKGDLLMISQSRRRVRGGREGPVETRAGKAPSSLSSTGRAEGMSCAGGPPTPCLPLQG